jgi:hypothetical protein
MCMYAYMRDIASAPRSTHEVKTCTHKLKCHGLRCLLEAQGTSLGRPSLVYIEIYLLSHALDVCDACMTYNQWHPPLVRGPWTALDRPTHVSCRSPSTPQVLGGAACFLWCMNTHVSACDIHMMFLSFCWCAYACVHVCTHEYLHAMLLGNKKTDSLFIEKESAHRRRPCQSHTHTDTHINTHAHIIPTVVLWQY